MMIKSPRKTINQKTTIFETTFAFGVLVLKGYFQILYITIGNLTILGRCRFQSNTAQLIAALLYVSQRKYLNKNIQH